MSIYTMRDCINGRRHTVDLLKDGQSINDCFQLPVIIGTNYIYGIIEPGDFYEEADIFGQVYCQLTYEQLLDSRINLLQKDIDMLYEQYEQAIKNMDQLKKHNEFKKTLEVLTKRRRHSC